MKGKEKGYYNLILVFIALLLFCCKERKAQVKVEETENSFKNIVYDSFGNKKGYYHINEDSILVKESCYYYSNSKIQRWYWYDADTNNIPVFLIEYDSIGRFKQVKGMPFLNAHTTKEGKTAIELVQVPIFKTFLEYRDYYKDSLIEKVIYEPGVTDSTLWVTLDSYKYDINHNYYIYYVLMDSSYSFLVRDSIELVP